MQHLFEDVLLRNISCRMLCLRQPLLVLGNFWMFAIQLSLVIASEQPQRLSEFYSFATNGDLQPGKNNHHYLIVHENGMNIQIYKPSEKRSFSNSSRRSALCLQQPPSLRPLIAIKEWSKRLETMGAVINEQPRLEPFGAESWMIDPEGNHLLIFVPISP